MTTVDVGSRSGSSVHSSPDPSATRHRDDLVVLVAEGMTSKLTYDGVDVCASRCAYEVSEPASVCDTVCAWCWPLARHHPCMHDYGDGALTPTPSSTAKSPASRPTVAMSHALVW